MSDQNPVSPDRIFAMVQGYTLTAALKGAIELELFTHIAAGSSSVAQLAKACDASERGIRMLCDNLCVHGLLSKTDKDYALADDARVFLDKASPQYIGDISDFLLSDFFIRDIGDVAAAVRKGGVVSSPKGSDEVGHPMWVDFARAMTGLQRMPGGFAAAVTELPDDRAIRVLDIASGPGTFGVAIAEKYPQAQITALDWENVLEVTRENAESAGVVGRFHFLPGSAFEVDLGEGVYDAVLVPNFLHHFDEETNVNFLRRVGVALKPGGMVCVVEFVPNEDRISPPGPASFALHMLRQTESGDAWTLNELKEMFDNAGLEFVADHAPPGKSFTVVLGQRPASR